MWDSVGDDITNLVQEFLRSKSSLKNNNKTFIILILKKNNPQSTNDFRLISLATR